jgi:hypothetical protein
MIGEGEHGVERRMLDQADRVSEPETMRERARTISESADRHLAKADRLSDGAPDGDEEAATG